jgi:hypothetical protein
MLDEDAVVNSFLHSYLLLTGQVIERTVMITKYRFCHIVRTILVAPSKIAFRFDVPSRHQLRRKTNAAYRKNFSSQVRVF